MDGGGIVEAGGGRHRPDPIAQAPYPLEPFGDGGRHPPASIVARAGAPSAGQWAASAADADDHRYKHDPRARWAPPAAPPRAPRPGCPALRRHPECTRGRQKLPATISDGARRPRRGRRLPRRRRRRATGSWGPGDGALGPIPSPWPWPPP